VHEQNAFVRSGTTPKRFTGTPFGPAPIDGRIFAIRFVVGERENETARSANGPAKQFRSGLGSRIAFPFGARVYGVRQIGTEKIISKVF